ncbi:YoaK family protein [Granulibacter bethesdensis]|uniref:Membrane spanning protein n=2 Tax=Granulibacter bethesdensis TaxID=364410 RepID=Q0BT74_GRABC|nr:YoaK family protein [Granulibacter bethesdensis]ABI61978.1 putative membrane spanning protein [Granulibacter bethesdensis CGDNIH1]AHJ62895.1 putative membrane spanning protein [Granulibacter bethesdensis]AHJ66535.1 putative membrane spanning protein [Granulibacter bethesdensis CGDNIH4]AHJ69128.1 putative membrane spanning protein [Granulibacter bethesdensis]APH51795.1 putative membrane spanning protein [Granulibacter bethesdensis]
MPFALTPRVVRIMRATVGFILVFSLSMLAGMTDAIGFLSVDEFMSFMSGNTTRMGVALSLENIERFERLALVIAMFVVGNALGMMLSYSTRRLRIPVLMLFISTLLCIAAGWPGDEMGTPSLVCAVIAMGALNNVVDNVEGVALALTYVSGALSKFGRGLGRFMMGDRNLDWLAQIVPWGGLVVGATIGAALQEHYGRHGLWACFAVSLILTTTTVLIPRAWQRRFG